MKIEQRDLIAVCKQYGSFVQNLPASLDGARLLWAITGNESNFGRSVNARHEAEYCPQKHIHSDGVTVSLRAGRHSMGLARQIDLYREFGCLACCSYTPWQIMAVNAIGYTPIELLLDLEKGASAVIGHMSRCFAGKEAGLCIEEIAKIWNGSGVSIAYTDELKKNYAAGIPL
jgi:hypothetical protein